MRFSQLALLTILPLALGAGASAITVNGGGPAKSDCYVGFDVTADRGVRLKGRSVEESACGGSCNFKVRACSGITVGGCTNPPTLKSVKPSSGIAAPPLDAAGCGAEQTITLTPKGKRPAKKKLSLVALADAKPKKDADKTTLVCAANSDDCVPSTTTTTTLPDPCLIPGARVFAFGANSHIYAGLVGPDQPAEIAGTATGRLVLVKGTPGSDGVATLSLNCDTIFGLQVLDGSWACLRIEAAGSHGKIDCDGGTPVDVIVSGDSHEDTDHHNDPPSVQIEQGAPGPPGSAYLIANARFVNCADDGSHDGVAGGCLAPFGDAGSAACADPTKVDFSLSKLTLPGGVTTTGTAMTTIANGKANGAPGPVASITKTGQPFDCNNFTTPGTGILETPAMFYDFSIVNSDVTAMLQSGE